MCSSRVKHHIFLAEGPQYVTTRCNTANMRLAAVAVLALLLYCTASAQAQKVVKGPDTKVFNGTGNTYFTLLDAAGAPTSAGLNLSTAALESIPSTMDDGKRCIKVPTGAAADAEVAACEAANATLCFGHKYRGMDFTIRPPWQPRLRKPLPGRSCVLHGHAKWHCRCQDSLLLPSGGLCCLAYTCNDNTCR
jgi:hypothetical protein